MNSVKSDHLSVTPGGSTPLLKLANEEVVDLVHYWRTIKRAKWIIALITTLCLIIGGFIASNATPIYMASAKIIADPQQPNANRNEQYIATALVFLYYETQYEIIKSRKIAETVVDKLALVDKYKQSRIESGNQPQSDFKNTIEAVKTEISALFNNKETTTKPALSDADIKIMLASNIQAGIKVSGGKQSQIINISYTSPIPQEAADIVNAISKAYIEFGLESRLGEVKNTESWLTEQYGLLKTKLLASEKQLSDYRSQQGLVHTDQQQRVANTQLQSLNNELIRAQTKLSAAKEQYLAIKNVSKDSTELYSLSPVLSNRTASDMVKSHAKLSVRVNELSKRYGEKHPKMIAARAELKSAKENVSGEVHKVVNNIETNYRLAKVQVNNISQLLSEARDQMQSVQSQSFSLVSLEREVENNRRIYENFQVSLMETSGKSEFTASNVHIIDQATVPQFPFKPNVKLILLLSLVAGGVLGVVVAFFREALDSTIKTPDEVEEKLNVAILGITPGVKKTKNGVSPELQYRSDQNSIFAENINTIRTGLLFSNIDHPPKVILVTSASASEGKSTMALNLAMAYSHIGKTLFLEVDFRKPSVSKSLGLPPKMGLTDLVAGSVTSTNDIFHSENNGQLSILTSGTHTRSPLELISSNKFEDTLLTLKKHFDYIVLDGPPTLPVSDSCILANKVDGVLFAIKAQSTKVKAAKEAISRLHKHHANVIGSVLTVAETQKMSHYGEHYYGEEYYGVKPDSKTSESAV